MVRVTRPILGASVKLARLGREACARRHATRAAQRRCIEKLEALDEQDDIDTGYVMPTAEPATDSASATTVSLPDRRAAGRYDELKQS